MKHIVKFLGIQFVAYFIISMVLLAGWATAAEGCHAYEADCYRRPLLNGRPGEMVRVCERVKLVCSAPVRQGTTTVQHVRGAL